MKRLLREPLLHFLLLGAAIFAAYSLVSKRSGDEPGKIVVTQGQIAAMAEGFTRTWRRPPTREELEGLIRDRVHEEVYCREAMALGLDKDDTIIRRRLRQKMEFVTDDVAALARADRRRVERVSATRTPIRFASQRQFTFSHVYLNPEKHGEHLARDAAQLLAQLNQAGGKADVSALGDAFLLEHTVRSVPAERGGETVRGTVRGEVGRPVARANGRGRSSPATACIWCWSANARKDACPRWRTCATPCVASGPTPGGWKRTRNSTRNCSSATW